MNEDPSGLRPSEKPNPNEDNLRHWRELFHTNPKYTQRFKRGGGFGGTATTPTYLYLHLTEHFGPIGIGWGMDEPKFTLVNKDPEILVYCILRCWYLDQETGQIASFWGIGGDLVIKKDSRGIWADDDAYKKAMTDAISNAFYRTGLNADIRMGLFDDMKYISDMKAHFQKGEEMKPHFQKGEPIELETLGADAPREKE